MARTGGSPQIGHTDARQLHQRWQEGEAVQILDVREPWEHADGYIEGAVLMPLMQVQTRWQELDPERPVHVICHLGSRSAMAGTFLTRHGLEAVNVDDGMDGWVRQGFPTVRQER